MEFIETPTFTRLILGVLIKGGGGIRKLRHAVSGHGKSSGIRVIYYWL